MRAQPKRGGGVLGTATAQKMGVLGTGTAQKMGALGADTTRKRGGGASCGLQAGYRDL